MGYGALFTDSKNIYQIRQSQIIQSRSTNGMEATPDLLGAQELLVFSTITRSWSAEPLRGTNVTFPSHGSLVSAPAERLGFWIGRAPGPRNRGKQIQPPNVIRRFDMASRDWTVEEVPFDKILDESVLFLKLGEKGILLRFGGYVEQDQGRDDPNDKGEYIETVHIYDIANHNWHLQETSGDERVSKKIIVAAASAKGIPRRRLNPCVFAIRPSNTAEQGYHIYMISGSHDDMALDEIWVLSVPSFRWTLLEQNSGVRAPTLQCYLVGKSQVLLLGNGRKSTAGNYKSDFIKILDLNRLNWTNNYHPSGDEYRTPELLLDTSQTDAPYGGFSSPYLGSLFYSSLSQSILKPREAPRNFSTSLSSMTLTAPFLSSMGGFISLSTTVSDDSSILSTQTSTQLNNRPTKTLSVQTTILSDAHTHTSGTTWQETTQTAFSTKEVQSTPRESIRTTGSSSYSSIDSQIQLIEASLSKYLNISTTFASSKTTLLRTWKTSVSSSMSSQSHHGGVTVTSTVRLPQMTVTMHLTASSTNSESSKTITTSYKRKAISTSSADGNNIGTTIIGSFTKITEMPDVTPRPTAIDESDTLESPPTNLKPYQTSTGIIAGSVVGGLGMIGGVAAITIIYCCGARRQRKKKRNSISEDLLKSVKQKRGLHSVEIRDLPPILTRKRKSRMDWVRFSKARGLHEVFEMEG
ncbi:hypothetical protein TWF718_009816 [Orbilia javanica]|uniref:Uncharacterized protein n=1 Tax=Orbilia javanica TaxID=47235 RepID=A0AAN8RAT6_9PEZI